MQSPDRAAAWEAEGRRLAPALDPISAAVVAGLDLEAASHLALGIARAQSGRRRVAVGDLSGGASVLTRLAADDDPHGLADTFLYGVSLNRVARQVDDEGRLFVVPAGSDSPLAVAGSDSSRWRRMAEGFRDVGALLLLVAPSDAPGVAAVAERMDGTVAVDHGAATQALPRLLATADTPDAALPRAGATRPTTPVVAPPVMPARRLHPALLAAIGLVVVVGLVWAARWVGRPRVSERPLFVAGASATDSLGPTDSLSLAAATPVPVAASDSVVAATPVDSAAANASPAAEAPLDVANPEDLARAAAWTIVYASVSDEDEAARRYRARPRSLAAPTISPTESDAAGERRHRVVSGGWRSRSLAVSALGTLRANGLVTDTAGRLVRLPYAVQLESSVARDSVVPALNRFLARGIPAYAMRQPSGRAHVYAGAFAEPSDARALLARLQADGVPAALVVRTGSPL